MANIERVVEFKQCQGRNPIDEIWWRIGNGSRRCGGVSMIASVIDGRVVCHPAVTALLSNGKIGESIYIQLPKDIASIRELGLQILGFVDEIEKTLKEQEQAKNDSKDWKQRSRSDNRRT